MTDEPLLCTVDQAARALGVGRTTMVALISTNQIDSVKIGRSRRVPHDAICEFIQNLRRGA